MCRGRSCRGRSGRSQVAPTVFADDCSVLDFLSAERAAFHTKRLNFLRPLRPASPASPAPSKSRDEGSGSCAAVSNLTVGESIIHGKFRGRKTQRIEASVATSPDEGRTMSAWAPGHVGQPAQARRTQAEHNVDPGLQMADLDGCTRGVARRARADTRSTAPAWPGSRQCRRHRPSHRPSIERRNLARDRDERADCRAKTKSRDKVCPVYTVPTKADTSKSISTNPDNVLPITAVSISPLTLTIADDTSSGNGMASARVGATVITMAVSAMTISVRMFGPLKVRRIFFGDGSDGTEATGFAERKGTTQNPPRLPLTSARGSLSRILF